MLIEHVVRERRGKEEEEKRRTDKIESSCLKYESTRPTVSFFCCFRITTAGLPATSYIHIKSCVIIHNYSKGLTKIRLYVDYEIKTIFYCQWRGPQVTSS